MSKEYTYEFRLSTGVSAEVTNTADLRQVLDALDRGVWFEDKYGWHLNPAQVVMVRTTDAEEPTS